MRRFLTIVMVLIVILIIIIVILLNQNRNLKRAENALFDVAISNTVSDYELSTIKETLDDIIQEKILYVYEDGSSMILRDLQKISFTYQELYRYYVAMYGDDSQIGNNVQYIFQDFYTFFDVLGKNSEYDLLKDNREKNLYWVSLENELYTEIEIITTIIEDLKNIRDEVYKDKAANDREAWRTLVMKNEEYAQTDKVQQQLKIIQQFIKMRSE